MSRWISLLGAMLLVLTLWAGEAAHAAERFECIPVSAQTAGHFEGDSDQRSSDREQGAGHHHSSCIGHQAAATLNESSVDFFHLAETHPLVRCEAGIVGWYPDAGLRPPIA